MTKQQRHHFSVELSITYGVEEAIFLSNLFFWSTNNLLTNRNIHEQKVWINLSRAKIQEYHPYFSTGNIRTITKKLKTYELIEVCKSIKGNYLSYTLTEKGWDYCLEEIEKEDRKNEIKIKLKSLKRISSPIISSEILINSLSKKLIKNSLLNKKIIKLYKTSNKFFNDIFTSYIDDYSLEEINLALENTIEAYRESHESPLANVSKNLLLLR